MDNDYDLGRLDKAERERDEARAAAHNLMNGLVEMLGPQEVGVAMAIGEDGQCETTLVPGKFVSVNAVYARIRKALAEDGPTFQCPKCSLDRARVAIALKHLQMILMDDMPEKLRRHLKQIMSDLEETRK